MKTKTFGIALLTVFSSLVCSFAGSSSAISGSIIQSKTSQDDWLKGKYATGNWGGWRDRLEDQGIDLFASVTFDPAGNVTGGKHKDFNYADDFFFGVNLDLQKLFGWKGGRFTISGINRDGSSIRESIGAVYDPQQTVGGQTIFLYGVFLEQAFFDNKLSIKIGRYSGSDDFNSSPIYNLYMNNGIDGDIRNVLFDTQFSAYPFNTWAARLKYQPTLDWRAELGVFQTSDGVFDRNRHGVDWSIHGNDGVILMAELGWTHEFNKQPVAAALGSYGKDGKSTAATPEMKGLPGHYWVGGSYAPWTGFNQFDGSGKTQNSYGFWAHADQMVYQEKPGSEQGLTLWTASGYYPQEDISIVPFQVNAGAIYKGLIPTRDEDRTILGLIYGKFSRDYARAIDAAGAGHPDYEFVAELGHRIQLAKFAYIQPDAQLVVNPGGTHRVGNALVLGVQMGVTF